MNDGKKLTNLRGKLVSEQRRALSIDGHSLTISKKVSCLTHQATVGEEEQISSDSDECYKKENQRSKTCLRRARPLQRTRSAFAPSPDNHFGPKGVLQKVQNDEHLIVIQDPSSQRLQWISQPNNFLIIRKPGSSTIRQFRTLIVHLFQLSLNVFVEPDDYKILKLSKKIDLKQNDSQLFVFDQKNDLWKIDLVVCLGGDGTLIHTARIFQQSCPPVLSFALGSLGFLTPFQFENHEQIIQEILSGTVAVLLRTRLDCELIKNEVEIDSSSDSIGKVPEVNEKRFPRTKIGESTLALNEVVIDRGSNSYLSNLDLYINDRFITKVQADGVIISTPTGSTAYAMAAGASMVHPNVPAMLIAPICPHSLSFRPTVVPAGIELKIRVSPDSRLDARLCIDGANLGLLTRNDCMRITTSIYPVPVICRSNPVGDWFESLAEVLHWNIRKPQSKLSTNSTEDEEDDNFQANDDSQSLEL